MRKAFAIAAAAAALGMSGTALAGPYYLKIEGVEGEATDKEHADWIPILSLQLAHVKTHGGATVSSGDVNGDGSARTPHPRATATITSSTASERASHELTHSVQQGAGKPDPAPARRVAAKEPEPVPAALLLPAVQKIRSTQVRKRAWPGCKAGQSLPSVEIRDEATGRTGRILDATVEQCAMEQVSLNFSKIKW